MEDISNQRFCCTQNENCVFIDKQNQFNYQIVTEYHFLVLLPPFAVKNKTIRN